MTQFNKIFKILIFSGIMTVFTVTAYAAADFCWRDQYGRGAGSIPESCGPGQEMWGGLCYPACGPGFRRVGTICYQDCKAGWRDDGAYCRLAEYGRGVGYGWDYWRCVRDHGNNQNACEQGFLGMWYPKCRPGFYPVTTNICRPINVPNCAAEGYSGGGQIDLSCHKIVNHQTGVTGICGPNDEEGLGLCYQKCKPNFKAGGLFCYQNAPPTWVECGAGAAKNSATCASVIVGQVGSVLMAAAKIGAMATGVGGAASAGATAAATGAKAAKGATAATRLTTRATTQAKKTFTEAKTAFNALKAKHPNLATAAKNAAQVGSDGKTIVSYNLTLSNATTTADLIRASAQMASMVDTTGISDVVASYSYPRCNEIFLRTATTTTAPAPSSVPVVATSQGVNLAKGKTAVQSSLYGQAKPGLAVDGNLNQAFNANSVTHTSATAGDRSPWWQVDLGAVYEINQIRIYNRTDCCSERLAGATVSWGTDAKTMAGAPIKTTKPLYDINTGGAYARYVKVQLPKVGALSLAEVEVYGNNTPIAPFSLACTAPGQNNCYDEVGYLARYPDLQNAFVQNKQVNWAGLQNHWNTQGHPKEKRNAQMLAACGNAGGVAELKSAPIDPCFYRNKYPDLKNAFGNDQKRLIAHWFSNGKDEGRISSVAAEQAAVAAAAANAYKSACTRPGQGNCYDEVGYLARYPDLQNAFVQNKQVNWAALQNHWNTQGHPKEKRNAQMLAACGNAGGVAELKSAPIDPCFYRNKYPDLKNAFGNDQKRLIAHWFSNGKYEGRISSMTAEAAATAAAAAAAAKKAASQKPVCKSATQANCYDEVAYLSRYPDLQNAFVQNKQINWAALHSHWINNGFREKRNAVKLSACGNAGGLAELKALPIDPCFYRNAYPDLKNAFGNDHKRLISHWFSNGIFEGRKGSAN